MTPPGRQSFKPLAKLRYPERVARVVGRRILIGEMETGQRLPSEVELAEEFEVSRAVIREALRLLESAGLVSIRKGPTGGIFAANVLHKPISDSLKNLLDAGRADVINVFDVRLMVEPQLAAEAARRADEKDIDRLSRLLARAGREDNGPVDLRYVNLHFHLELARISANPILTILVESLLELVGDTGFDLVDPEFEKEALERHRELLRLVAEGQAEDAARFTEQELRQVRDRFVSHFDLREEDQ